MTEKGLHKSIVDDVLEPNMNLALVLGTERTTSHGEVRCWFFRVMRAMPLVLVQSKQMPNIAPGATLAPNYIGVTGFGAGDDFLEIPDDRPFQIYHYAIGLRPSTIRMYRQYAGVMQAVLYPKVTHAVGNPYGFADGVMSPFIKPTVIAKDIVVEGVRVRYGFNNDSAIAVRPSIKVLGAGYDVLPITDPTFINRIIAGIIPCAFEPLGGFRTFTFTKPKEWQDETVITQQKLLEAMKR